MNGRRGKRYIKNKTRHELNHIKNQLHIVQFICYFMFLFFFVNGYFQMEGWFDSSPIRRNSIWCYSMVYIYLYSRFHVICHRLFSLYMCLCYAKRLARYLPVANTNPLLGYCAFAHLLLLTKHYIWRLHMQIADNSVPCLRHLLLS